MARNSDVNLKFKLTVGSFLLWLSFFLPFVLINIAHTAASMVAAFAAPSLLAVFGYFVSCWQDFRTKTPHSAGRLVYVVTLLIVLLILMPVFVSTQQR